MPQTARQTSSAEPLFQQGVKCLGEKRYGDADALFAQATEIDPDHAPALHNRGVLRCITGQHEDGIAFMKTAFALSPQDDVLRNNLARVYQPYTRRLDGAGRTKEALDTLRCFLALCDDPAERVNLTDLLARSGQPAILSDFAPGLDAGTMGQHVLVACMPKSGSSFLHMALRKLTGWPQLGLVNAYLQNEQEIYPPALRDAAYCDSVIQQHVRATDANVQMLQAYGLRPVVLVRNLFDIVLSMSDFYDTGAVRNSFLQESWPLLDQAGKYDALIDHLMPWYLGFCVSWDRAASRGALPILRLSYEDMIADKPGTLKRIADHVGFDTTPDACAAAVSESEGDRNRKQTRFNKGVAGRGDAALTDAQKDRVRRLAASYRGTDFSPIGL
jgi:tetratricopeptide (TPR) repeat protein